jgi:hypothetical protein
VRPELDRLHLIEQHLLGHPGPEDAAAWQVRLLLDPDLSIDTAAQQLAYDGLLMAGRRQLRRELTAIHLRLYGPERGPWSRLQAAYGAVRAWWQSRRRY